MLIVRIVLLTIVTALSASDGYHPSTDPAVLNNLADKFNDYTRKLRDGIVDLEARRELVKAWRKTKLEE